jgi:hypothetical protein
LFNKRTCKKVLSEFPKSFLAEKSSTDANSLAAHLENKVQVLKSSYPSKRYKYSTLIAVVKENLSLA